MSKLEVNNEIVLMRHVVRRARLHTVRKLIKQVKLLGLKKGDDKQREKYKRKGAKLSEELTVLKKLQDDEISKFSITNERKLEDVLNDLNSDPATCVLARLASQKLIKDKVDEFKKKFPNYEEHLGPGRRKLIKLKRKAGKVAKKEAKSAASISEVGENETPKTNSDDDDEDDAKEIADNSSIAEENSASESQEEIPRVKRKAEQDSSLIEKRTKVLKKEPAAVSKPKEKFDKLSGLPAPNKESTIKSFARFLKDKDEGTPSPSPDIIDEGKLVLEKEVDSFFMTDDGSGEYLSVVVPKSNAAEDEESDPTAFENHGSARSRNNRFFDKVDRVERAPRRGAANNTNGFSRGGRFQDRNQNRDIKGGVYARGKDFANEDKRKSADQTVHPSWAAKKKEQEILKLGFQGKKIVFDD